MKKHVRTAKGRVIDMDSLFMANQKTIAIGNASLNARGDYVKNGKVVKTVEERRDEYEIANNITTTTKTVSVHSGFDSDIDGVEEIKSQPKSELKNDKKNNSEKNSETKTKSSKTHSTENDELNYSTISDILNK